MDIGNLEREIATRIEGERPQGWPTDPRGDFFWGNQVLTTLMQEYEGDPAAQDYLKKRMDELKAVGYDAPIKDPTAQAPLRVADSIGGIDG